MTSFSLRQNKRVHKAKPSLKMPLNFEMYLYQENNSSSGEEEEESPDALSPPPTPDQWTTTLKCAMTYNHKSTSLQDLGLGDVAASMNHIAATSLLMGMTHEQLYNHDWYLLTEHAAAKLHENLKSDKKLRGIRKRSAPEIGHETPLSELTIARSIMKRRVSFADDAGMPLTSICITASLSRYRYNQYRQQCDNQDSSEAFWNECNSMWDDSRYVKTCTEDETPAVQPGAPPATVQQPPDAYQPPSPTEPTDGSTLRCCFEQPVSKFEQFADDLNRNCVVLENLKFGGNQRMLGTVRVLNLGYDKSVTIRCTSDNWLTHTDVECSYVKQCSSPASDVFAFEVTVSHHALTMSFAIRYCVNDQEFWDNNCGNNYEVRRIF